MKSESKITPSEFLDWSTKWAIQLVNHKSQHGNIGTPMLLGMAEDGTHHANLLTFWDFKNDKSNMEILRTIVEKQKIVACTLVSMGRVTRENTVVESLVLVKAEKGRDPKMELFLAMDSGSGIMAFANEPSEIVEEISGELTRFWTINN